MDLKGRVFFQEPKRVKLWKLKYNPVIRDVLPDSPETKIKPGDTTIIDFGAWFTRAGYSSQKDPSLIFKTLVCKAKREKVDLVQVGNMIKEYEYHKAAVRSPYDKGLLSDITLFENTCDYIFKELGFRGESIDSPIMYTEPLLNPSKYRMQALELFFEGYGVPRALPCVDTFASLLKTFKNGEKSSFNK
jgi:actin-related protein